MSPPEFVSTPWPKLGHGVLSVTLVVEAQLLPLVIVGVQFLVDVVGVL